VHDVRTDVEGDDVAGNGGVFEITTGATEVMLWVCIVVFECIFQKSLA
jgi:hypothetical protein